MFENVSNEKKSFPFGFADLYCPVQLTRRIHPWGLMYFLQTRLQQQLNSLTTLQVGLVFLSAVNTAKVLGQCMIVCYNHCRPVYSYDLGTFCTPKFLAYKKNPKNLKKQQPTHTKKNPIKNKKNHKYLFSGSCVKIIFR